jgi:lysophospholipid acyltransferase
VWILTEGASILSGLGFTGNGPSGVPTWNGAANVDVWKIEVPENFKGLIDSWNIKTNVWLRECVYKRVTSGYVPNHDFYFFFFLPINR